VVSRVLFAVFVTVRKPQRDGSARGGGVYANLKLGLNTYGLFVLIHSRPVFAGPSKFPYKK